MWRASQVLFRERVLVSCYPQAPSFQSVAADVGARLNLPIIEHGFLPKVKKNASTNDDSDQNEHRFLLMIGDRIEIQKPDQGIGSLFCDFVEGRLDWKRKHGDLANSALIRACTLARKPVSETHIVDGTGGLGSDAFMLASRGFRVSVVERHPIVHELLFDGWKRACQNASSVADIAKRMTIIHADSTQYVSSLEPSQRPHVVLLDPMYPSPANVRKQALPKKGMQYLRQLVGSDPDDVSAMALAAFGAARHRFVLKRPSYAPQELVIHRPVPPNQPAQGHILQSSRISSSASASSSQSTIPSSTSIPIPQPFSAASSSSSSSSTTSTLASLSPFASLLPSSAQAAIQTQQLIIKPMHSYEGTRNRFDVFSTGPQ